MSGGTLNTYRAGGYEREAKENLCPSRKVVGDQWEMAADAFARAAEFHLERLSPEGKVGFATRSCLL